MKQVLLKIRGIVQGVNFRWHTKSEADKLKLTGWVKNEGDGSVLVCAQGEDVPIKEFTDWCAHGPDSAKVTGTKKTWLSPDLSLIDFQIRY